MVHITLVCSGGFSSSMLVTKMKEAAQKKGLDVEIRAMAETAFEKYEGQTDVLLLGPQISFLLDEFQTTYGSKGMKVEVIDSTDYGMMNGENVLERVFQLVNE